MRHLEPRSGKAEDGALEFECVEDSKTLWAIAHLFATNVDTAYITLSDFMSDRIDENLRWEKGLQERFVEEYDPDGGYGELIVVRDRLGNIIGFMSIAVDSLKQYAILGDIMINPRFRRSGYGSMAYRWLERQLKGMGIRRVLIANGIHNTGAEAFFSRLGFRDIAIERIKEL